MLPSTLGIEDVSLSVGNFELLEEEPAKAGDGEGVVLFFEKMFVHDVRVLWSTGHASVDAPWTPWSTGHLSFEDERALWSTGHLSCALAIEAVEIWQGRRGADVALERKRR